VPSPLRGLPREVGVLVAVAFAVAVGFGVVVPAIPVFAREFGVGRTAAGAVVSAFAVMRFVSALGGGRLVDRFGERRILATGIGVVAVSSALAGLAQSYAQLLVLRGVGGIGSAMFTVSAYSLLLRSVGTQQRGRAAGMFSGGFLLGGICGPAIGGLVTGQSLRAPFFLYAGTLAVAGSIGLLALPKPAGAGRAPDRGGGVALRAAVRSPAYRAAAGALFAESWAVLGVRAALVPLFVTEALALEPVWIGIGFVVLAAADVATLLPAGRVADRRGRRPVLLTGCALAATGMALLALLPSLGGYLAAMAVVGVGSGMLHVAPGAILGDVVTAGGSGRGGTAVAAYQMAGDAGSVLGPVAAGLLADGLGYGAAFAVTAGVLAGAGGLALAAPETLRPVAVPTGGGAEPGGR
jgi:DHA1 family multidrug resistance protein-like MFS transporter